MRVEQISPFPFRSLRATAQRYKNAHHIWAQEESKNAGCWSYVEARFNNHLEEQGCAHPEISYAGRPISASTATGMGVVHSQQ